MLVESASAPTDPASNGFATAFEDAFSATLEDVAADWATLSTGDRGDAWIWLPECDSERVPAVFGEGPVAVEPELSCAEIASVYCPLDVRGTPTTANDGGQANCNTTVVTSSIRVAACFRFTQ